MGSFFTYPTNSPIKFSNFIQSWLIKKIETQIWEKAEKSPSLLFPHNPNIQNNLQKDTFLKKQSFGQLQI